MWKVEKGKLIQTVDTSRVEYKTRISKVLLENLKQIAKDNKTTVGYLLENGFENILKEDFIHFDKKARPKDRVEFRTTCDQDILEQLRIFAKKNKLNLNDVIEASSIHINLQQVKNEKWRYRIELS